MFCVFLRMFWCYIRFTMSVGVSDSAITAETNRNSRDEARILRLIPLANLFVSQL